MSLDIEKDCLNYSNFNKIGYSAYGTVYRVTNKINGCYVAIKELIKEKFENPKELIQKEINIMEKFKNENSVKFIELIESRDYYYIIMEYCEYNLQSYLTKKRNTPLSIKEIKKVLSDLNKTLKIILKENLIHRDIKPNNILISLDQLDNNSIKLSDYCFTEELNNYMSISGIPLIMAPEVMNDEEDLSKSDLWSLGILIYYMYFKEYPYNGNNEITLLNDINFEKKLKTIPNDYLNDLFNE